MQPAVPSIICKRVVKNYDLGSGASARAVAALRGIDLEISGTGFFAIMGASGSGKSTLLHLLAGLDQPTSGEVHVAGQRVDLMTERELTRYRRRSIGIVFQSFNLLPSMSALDNVILPALLDSQPRGASERRGRELLKDLGVIDRADHRPDALSGGEQQRVAIARALFFAPPLLLADEPTGNLDSASAARLFALLADVARVRNTLLLMVTHDPAAAAHCERVIVLRDGTVAGAFNTEHIDAGTLALRAQELAGSTR